MAKDKAKQKLLRENEELKFRLQEAEDTLAAIREGAVDAVVVSSPKGEQIFTLSGEDQIYRLLVETMSEGGLTTSPEGRILFCNERFSRMLGKPMEEITGRSIEEFVQDSYLKSLKELLSDAQNKLSRKRIVLQAANGEGVPSLISANLLQQADSTSICLVVTDISAVEASEEVIRQITEQKKTIEDSYDELHKSRLASLNLMEDAQILKEQAEVFNANLQKEIEEHKKAEEALVWNSRRNELLSETASGLLQSEAPQKTIEQLCKQVMSFLDCQVFFNFLVDEQTGRLHLNACSGIDNEEARKIQWLDYGGTVCGCVARDKQRIIAGDISKSDDPATSLVKSYGIQAYCCHPLMIQDRLIGTLSFGTRTKSSFNEDEIEVMKSVADLAAIALYRIETEQQIKNIARFPAENPHPVLRVKADGTIVYSNIPGQDLLSEWSCQVGQKVPDNWLTHIENSLRYDHQMIEQIKCGQSVFSITVAPIPEGGYVNLYGRDITIQEQIKDELRKSRDELDVKVHQRTSELAQTIAILQREIKERITAQMELKESTKVLDAFFAHTITPLVILDAKFNFIRVNQAYADSNQMSINDFAGKNHFVMFPDTENEKIFKKVVTTKQYYQTLAKPFKYPQHPEWGITYWDWTLVPILDMNENVEFLVFSLNDVTRRKQAEIALLESEEKYRGLVEFSPEAVCVMVDEKIVFANSASMKLVKAKNIDEVFGKSVWDFIHADSTRSVRKDLKSLVEQKQQIPPREIKMILLDGSVMEVETTATPVIHQGSNGILVMFHDITERKASERRKTVLSSLLDLFVATTSKKEYMDSVVEVIQDWSGCKYAGVRLRDDDGFLPFESFAGFSDEFISMENSLSLKTSDCVCVRIVEQKPRPEDFTMLTSKGSFRCDNFNEFVSSIPNEGKKPEQYNCGRFGFSSLAVIPIRYREKILGVIHLADELAGKAPLDKIEFIEDMASMIGEALHRFDVENTLRLNEKRLLEAQRFAHLGNWEWDITRNRLWWSDEVYRIFGYEPRLFGVTYDDFMSYVHPDDCKLVQESTNNALLENKDFDIDYRIIRPDKSERIVNVKAEVTFDSNSKPVKMAGMIYDITEQKKAEDEIRKNQLELRALSAELQLAEEQERRRIAQDLHDSIGQILSFSGRELKQLQKSVSEKAAKTIREISNQLDLAVTQTRTLSFDLSPSTLYDLGFEVAIEDLVDKITAERNILCSFSNCRQPKPLKDEVKVLLYRSVRELLYNAVKHAQAEHVNVSLLRSSSDIYIKVEDDGKGFDVSILDNSATKRKGFGIFSIRERLNHIGGKLKIESAKGQGTRAVLIAPLDVEQEIR